jgi:uncharacterized membrane protein YgcG
MPRFVYLILFLIVAVIPFLFFGLLSQTNTVGNAYSRGYSRGPSFFFLDLDFDGSSRGRGYSSGGFQGGGSRSGK